VDDLQELLRKFDGVGGNVRLAWYGQQRAAGLSHEAAIEATRVKFSQWCAEVWPVRKIEA
jgi:hypothetical protein